MLANKIKCPVKCCNLLNQTSVAKFPAAFPIVIPIDCDARPGSLETRRKIMAVSFHANPRRSLISTRQRETRLRGSTFTGRNVPGIPSTRTSRHVLRGIEIPTYWNGLNDNRDRGSGCSKGCAGRCSSKSVAAETIDRGQNRFVQLFARLTTLLWSSGKIVFSKLPYLMVMLHGYNRVIMAEAGVGFSTMVLTRRFGSAPRAPFTNSAYPLGFFKGKFQSYRYESHRGLYEPLRSKSDPYFWFPVKSFPVEHCLIV